MERYKFHVPAWWDAASARARAAAPSVAAEIVGSIRLCACLRSAKCCTAARSITCSIHNVQSACSQLVTLAELKSTNLPSLKQPAAHRAMLQWTPHGQRQLRNATSVLYCHSW